MLSGEVTERLAKPQVVTAGARVRSCFLESPMFRPLMLLASLGLALLALSATGPARAATPDITGITST